MTEQINVILNQIIIFSILMLIGFIAAKAKVLSKEGLNDLSKLIIKIIIPALIFSIVAGSGVSINDFFISGRFALGVIICFAVLFVAGILIGKLQKLKGKTENVFIALFTFGNMGFMGIPLIQAVFTEPIAQVCITIYTIIDMALLWTVGVYLCSRHQKSSSKNAVKNMLNPTTVALVAAFIVMAFKIPIPNLLMSTVSGIGGTSKYITLIYLGAALAFVSVEKAVKKPSIFVIVILKMLAIPIIAYLLLGFFLPQTPKTILTLIVGLPSMTSVAMIARTYQSDDEYATEVIFITTLFSLITIPLVSIIINMI